MQEQTGQSNDQQIVYGCTLGINGTHNYNFDVLAGEVCIGQELKSIAAALANTVPAGAELLAGQKCYVLVEVNAAGEVFKTVSAITGGATPVLPALTANRIAIAYLSLSGVFTPGTTALTEAMLKPVLYSAGNISPTTGF